MNKKSSSGAFPTRTGGAQDDQYPKLNLKRVETLIEARIRFRLYETKFVGPDPKFKGQEIAINEAGLVLLSATIQAYMERVFLECRDKVYGSQPVPNSLRNKKNGCPEWGNPNDENLNRLFGKLGIVEPLRNFPEPVGCRESFALTLKKINQVRNRIAHGEPTRIDGKPFTMDFATLGKWADAAEICCPAFRFFVFRSSGSKPIKVTL